MSNDFKFSTSSLGCRQSNLHQNYRQDIYIFSKHMQTIFGIIWIYFFGRGRFHSFYGLVAAASYFARSCLDWRYKQYIHNNHRIWPRNCWLNAWWSNSSKDLLFIYWGQIHWDCGRLPLDPSRDHLAWRKFWITIIPRVLQKMVSTEGDMPWISNAVRLKHFATTKSDLN